MFDHFFQTFPLPANQITGSYSIALVILSYLIGSVSSYVALDITGRMRDVSVTRFTSYMWLIGGSFAMGAGIWSMHFIGMLAFIMPVPMEYDLFQTGLSMLVAIGAAGLAFSLLRSRTITLSALIAGGIILGFAIAAMHYIGMGAMKGHMGIRYIPGIFLLSIFIAIAASEAALYLAIKSSQPNVRNRFLLKIVSALIMGTAICGMHYTGMAATVFTPLPAMDMTLKSGTDSNILPFIIAMTTFFILTLAIALSSFNEALSSRAIALARQAGMTEVASSVLHNVGNVLNSVNISSTLIRDHLEAIDLGKLDQVNRLIQEHREDLEKFIQSERGSRLPGYLVSLAETWQKEKQSLQAELSRLDENIQHIKGIISAQQSMNTFVSFAEQVSVEKLVEEALILASLESSREKIQIKKEYSPLKTVIIDKLKLSQILINLIQNAKDALLASSVQEKMIRIRIGAVDKEHFFIEVADNGIGIDPADKARLFTYGFTTKKSGHGLGLHSSIILSNDMRGSLSVQSEGINKGAVFRVEMPCCAEEKNQDALSRQYNIQAD